MVVPVAVPHTIVSRREHVPEQIQYLEVREGVVLSDRQIEDINVLLNQLTERIFCSRNWVEEVSKNGVFVVAYLDDKGKNRIVGMALLCAIKNLSVGHVGYVHDVIVHIYFRRRGIMTGLMATLHNRARAMGLDALELTSNPNNEDRLKAIQGYLKMGYRQKHTGVFVYRLR
ncbi:MAG: GNAT family N-acetyltransferase [Patescibacteria group bacterium]|nr:GNAT family N-acetyltransferase [Patescibacteria group bacterium]